MHWICSCELGEIFWVFWAPRVIRWCRSRGFKCTRDAGPRMPGDVFEPPPNLHVLTFNQFTFPQKRWIFIILPLKHGQWDNCFVESLSKSKGGWIGYSVAALWSTEIKVNQLVVLLVAERSYQKNSFCNAWQSQYGSSVAKWRYCQNWAPYLKIFPMMWIELAWSSLYVDWSEPKESAAFPVTTLFAQEPANRGWSSLPNIDPVTNPITNPG